MTIFIHYNKDNKTKSIVPYCPASSPNCDASSHECTAESGSVLLKRIVVTTASCEGCDQEGIYMRLTGLQDYIYCHTNTLDHADSTDFSPSQNGNFNTETDDKVEDGWGGCFEVRSLIV